MNLWQICKNCISEKLFKNVIPLKTKSPYFSKTFAVGEPDQGVVSYAESLGVSKIFIENLNLCGDVEVGVGNYESTTLDNFKNILIALKQVLWTA